MCNKKYYFRKNGKLQKRGKINLIGRLQLSTERSKEEDNECIVQLRILRVQVSISFPKTNFVLHYFVLYYNVLFFFLFRKQL